MASFPTTPKAVYSFTKEVEFKTLISQFENGVEQRRNKWSQGKRQFTVLFDLLSPTNMGYLYDFYVARKGSYESFVYIDPITSSSVDCRFVDDKLSFEEFSHDLRRTGLKLIQVL
jgi:uncharacterized protein (TIGR02217 family)